jgi:integrase
LSVEAYEAIQRWLSERGVNSPIVFTRFRSTFVKGNQELQETEQAMSACAIWRLVQRYMKQCGFAYLKPHDFRRFMVTRVIKTRGLRQAQQAAGHKRIETTILYDLGELEPGLTDSIY